MKSLLRKIRYDLMGPNKTGKYFKYAIGEIILVVIGILIALQINNWNENRNNRIKEQTIISEINKEFTKNKQQLAYIKSRHQFHLDNITKVVSFFPINKNNTNLDSLSHYMRQSFADWTFEPTQDRVKWLVNSPNFDLIQNDELRDALLLWKPTFDDFHEDEQSALSYNETSLYPYLRKNFSVMLNLNDPRMNLEHLSSMEFEQMMYSRKNRLRAILENDTNELQRLEKLIDNIIALTKNND